MGVIENRIDITELERSGGGGGGGTAASVSYDNTSSGLTAETVQGAIDEVASGLSGANTNITGLGNALTATQGNLAPVENGETSTHAYAVGDYLMHLNSLMRVTAPIAIGDTFAAGTNITAADDISLQIQKGLKLGVPVNRTFTTVEGFGYLTIPYSLPTGYTISTAFISSDHGINLVATYSGFDGTNIYISYYANAAVEVAFGATPLIRKI